MNVIFLSNLIGRALNDVEEKPFCVHYWQIVIIFLHMHRLNEFQSRAKHRHTHIITPTYRWNGCANGENKTLRRTLELICRSIRILLLYGCAKRLATIQRKWKTKRITNKQTKILFVTLSQRIYPHLNHTL